MAGTWKKLAFAEDVHSIPSGGSAGQTLIKQSATDYDAAWGPSGFFEIDVNGGLEPITGTGTDEQFELDANDDIQPKATP